MSLGLPKLSCLRSKNICYLFPYNLSSQKIYVFFVSKHCTHGGPQTFFQGRAKYSREGGRGRGGTYYLPKNA